MTYIAVRQLLPRLHNLCHVDSRVTMLRYSLRGHAQVYNHKKILSVCCHHTPAYPENKRQSYVVLNEFEWNGLKVINLKNRKFLEAIASHLNL